MAGMIHIGFIIGIAIIVATAVILFEREHRKRLGVYWQRSCTRTQWYNCFPDVSKEAIHEFLQIFVDGFAFSSKKCFKFSPDDKVMDIYSSLYPVKGWPDALEIETFAINLEEKYGLELAKIEDYDITLGRLFEMTRNPNR